MRRRYLMLVCLLLLFALPTMAQNETIIAVQSDVTAVETGQFYTVSLILRDAVEVWQVNAVLEYDPALLYVVGSVSGQPMSAGDFFAEQPSLMVRNNISTGQITYTHSLLAPAEPMDGSGTVATFTIFPLSAGTAQIRFTTADLTKVIFSDGAGEARDVVGTEDLPVLPALAEFTITGDTVVPPDEATPTPQPTATFVNVRDSEATEEAELVNVTLAPATAEPQAVPTLIPELADDDAGTLPILPLALGLLVVGGLGIGVVVVMSRREK